MAVIPWEVYQSVEWHLHNRAKLVRLALEGLNDVQGDALYGSHSVDDRSAPRGIGRYSDPTSVKALAIIKAQKKIEHARRWGFVADRTFAYFEGTKTSEIALAFYGQNTTIIAVADQIGIDRQTVRKYRDKFVCACALFASEEGLIKLHGKEAATDG